MGYTSLKVCSSGGAFEAVPQPRLALDLAEARRRLETARVPVIDARVMLIVRLEREVTLGRDGRVLIKTRDAAEAERVLGRLQELVGLRAK